MDPWNSESSLTVDLVMHGLSLPPLSTASQSCSPGGGVHQAYPYAFSFSQLQQLCCLLGRQVGGGLFVRFTVSRQGQEAGGGPAGPAVGAGASAPEDASQRRRWVGG